jgi:hypothetical protein
MVDDAGRAGTAGDLAPWADRLAALAPFATRVREADFVFGAWADSHQLPDGSWMMPYHELTDGGLALMAAFGSWIQVGFDWSTWARTDEGRRLLEEPAAMADATPEQIARLLTTIIRADRFNEGQLAGAWDSGYLIRLLDRVAVLRGAMDEER